MLKDVPTSSNGLLHVLSAGVMFYFASSASVEASETVPTRPNILFFIADDLGLGDVRCYDDESTIPTPNLDRLAREGMRFTDVHTPAAVCTPTRFSVLTGLYPFRSSLVTSVLFSAYDAPLLRHEMVTLPELLRDAGYVTAGFGKWHLGCKFGSRSGEGAAKPGIGTSKFTTRDVDFSQPITDGPIQHGFDYWFGLGSSINHGPYTFIENDRVAAVPDRIRPQKKTQSGVFREGWIADGWDDERIGESICKRARGWITQQAVTEKPFFIYFAEVAPHFPHVPPDDVLGTPIKGKGGADDNRFRADMVLHVDTILGKLLERLDDPNGDGDESDSVAENTLIIATSDNGADQGYYRPIREKKGTIWEGGHRVPFIVRYPRIVKPGTVNQSMFGLNDLYSTLARIAGTEKRGEHGRDSFDVGDVLTGKSVTRPEPLIIQEKGNSSTFAVREGHWKLIRREGKTELYDLATDLKETSDVAKQNPVVVSRLRQYLDRKLAN